MSITGLPQLHAELRTMLSAVHEICEAEGLEYFLAYGSALGAVRDGDFIPWDSDADVIVPVDGYHKLCDTLREHLPRRYAVATPDDPGYELLFSRVVLRGVHHDLVYVDLFPLVGAPSGAVPRYLVDRAFRLLNIVYILRLARPGARYPHHRAKRWLTTFGHLLLRGLPPRSVRTAFIWLCRRWPYGSTSLVYNACGSYGQREFIPARHVQGHRMGRLGQAWLRLPAYPEEYLTGMYGDFLTPVPPAEQARQLCYFEEFCLPPLRRAMMAVGSPDMDGDRDGLAG